MQTATSSHTISELNALLRGELAATETYQQALAKARRLLRADPNYTFVHTHLEVTNHFACNWAPSGTGQCPGRFLGGSPPFDNVDGRKTMMAIILIHVDSFSGYFQRALKMPVHQPQQFG